MEYWAELEGGRWTEARWLRLGDHFLTKTGKSATVVGLTIRMERVQVYNLQVKNLQLYAVGQAGVLVHNSVRPFSTGRNYPLDPTEALMMQAAAKGGGQRIPNMGPLNDPRLQGTGTWYKYFIRSKYGREVHYIQNERTGQILDIKCID